MIHKYQLNGHNIVIDVNSGAVHLLDEEAYELLNNYNEEGRLTVSAAGLSVSQQEAAAEIEALKQQDLLFSPEIYQEVLDKVEARQPVVKALCLHVAHDCNLKCRYCFAEEGEYHGRRSMMSKEVGKAAIDFLIKNSGGRINLEVDFFGGEPLMNFELVKEVVEYGREQEAFYDKKFRFTITTNGVLLNEEIQAYINAHMHNVVLSLDGRQEVNDAMRKTKNGKGSYETILPKLRQMAESREHKNYYVRGTFTRNNLDFSKDVLHLADLGFSQVSVEPVVGPEEEDYSISREDLPELFKEYEKLALEMLKREKEGKGFNFFHYMIDLSGGPCVAKRLVGCGAGTEYLAVTPDGELYPCHQFTGLEGFKIGTVFEGVMNHELREEFEGCHVFAKKDCRECWAKYYCSGGCAANGYNMGGSIYSVYDIGCQLQRKRIECAIMIKAQEGGNI